MISYNNVIIPLLSIYFLHIQKMYNISQHLDDSLILLLQLLSRSNWLIHVIQMFLKQHTLIVSICSIVNISASIILIATSLG